jgi:hypothetical protein
MRWTHGGVEPMMINFQLTNEEAKFLLTELGKERAHVENELVHTDKRAMQTEISRDLSALDRVMARLAHAVEGAERDSEADAIV